MHLRDEQIAESVSHSEGTAVARSADPAREAWHRVDHRSRTQAGRLSPLGSAERAVLSLLVALPEPCTIGIRASPDLADVAWGGVYGRPSIVKTAVVRRLSSPPYGYCVY